MFTYGELTFGKCSSIINSRKCVFTIGELIFGECSPIVNAQKYVTIQFVNLRCCFDDRMHILGSVYMIMEYAFWQAPFCIFNYISNLSLSFCIFG